MHGDARQVAGIDGDWLSAARSQARESQALSDLSNRPVSINPYLVRVSASAIAMKTCSSSHVSPPRSRQPWEMKGAYPNEASGDMGTAAKYACCAGTTTARTVVA